MKASADLGWLKRVRHGALCMQLLIKTLRRTGLRPRSQRRFRLDTSWYRAEPFRRGSCSNLANLITVETMMNGDRMKSKMRGFFE